MRTESNGQKRGDHTSDHRYNTIPENRSWKCTAKPVWAKTSLSYQGIQMSFERRTAKCSATIQASKTEKRRDVAIPDRMRPIKRIMKLLNNLVTHAIA